jgi:excisionase family DNA binding protein
VLSAKQRPRIAQSEAVMDQVSSKADPITLPALPASIERLCTIDDWCVALQVSRPTVERFIRDGRLPQADLRLGRLPRWRPATLKRFVEGGGE